MSQYNELNRVDPIPLISGLDFASAKVSAAEGSLSDCYNHEVSDRVGYKRIDGFERYDGRYPPSYANDGTIVEVRTFHEFEDGDPVVGDILLYNNIPFGKILHINSTNMWQLYIVRYSNAQLSEASLELDRTNEIFSAIIRTGAPSPGAVIGPVLAKDNIIESNGIYEGIQQNITKFPNDRRAHGLHWFKDRLYAVVDDLYIPFTSGSAEVFANDLIEWATEGFQAVVRDVQLNSGSWGAGTAAGHIVVQAVYSGNITYHSAWSSQNIDILRPNSGDELNAFTIPSSVNLISDPDVVVSASLWRTDNELLVDQGEMFPDNPINLGWNPIDMGFELDFIEGEYFFSRFNTLNRTNVNDPNAFSGPVVPSPSDSTNGGPQLGQQLPPNGPVGVPFLSAQGTPIQLNGGIPITVNNLNTPSNYQSDDGNGLVIVGTPTTVQAGSQRRFNAAFAFSDFIGLNTIPAGSSITGFEIRVKAYQTIGGTDNLPSTTPTAMFSRIRQIKSDGPVGSESRILELNRTGTSDVNAVEHVFGGPGDKFGITDDLHIEDITPTNLFVDFTFFTLLQPEGSIIDRTITIDYIKFIVYYTAPNSKVYFWDGVDDVSANIVSQWVRDGDLLIGDGEGTLQVYNVEPEAGATRQHINVGDEIRTAPNGAGNLLGEVNSFFRGSSLPSLSMILEKQSRYQAITANYYAREDWDAFYGVSGAGRAFVYDDFFFRNIFTGLDDDLDIPRHVAYHHGHLVLGYAAGVVEVSAAGRPEDYYTPGAFTEVGFGDRITGLVPMNGTTLGVLCESTIHGLLGTNVDDFNTQVLDPDSGCIEYTIGDIGKPIWCSYNGISGFDQTAAYGDFLGTRLSSIVHPWLLGRLKKNNGLYGLRGATSVVCAISIKDKNQYRVFFEDGYILTMTLYQDQPVFTIQQYYTEVPSILPIGVPNPLEVQVVVPIAHSVAVDRFGRNRVHVSHYSRFYPETNENGFLMYVLELDRGWSFAGTPIEAYFTTNWMLFGNPFETKRIAKVRLYGQSYGYGQIKVDVGRDFLQPDEEFVNISLPKDADKVQYPFDSDVELLYDLKPYSSIAEVAKHGINLCLRFTSSAVDNEDEDLHVQPPYVCQALLVQLKDGM